jgi:hypothetical protein
MTGTIIRLVDSRQVGSIAAEDGHAYDFGASSLRGVQFSDLSLGLIVSFMAGQHLKDLRAEVVHTRPVTKLRRRPPVRLCLVGTSSPPRRRNPRP